MQAFPIDRICCNPNRVRIGLACDADARFACAMRKLLIVKTEAPHEVERYLAPLFDPFPADVLLAACRSLDVVSEWTVGAARFCAARPTKDERRTFFEYISWYLSVEEYDALFARHDAEWHLMRGRRALGPK
jgi:hypothetical protein